MSRGKHSSKQSFKFNTIPYTKIFSIIVVTLVVLFLFIGGRKIYTSFSAGKNSYTDNQLEESNVEEIPKELHGYKILGELIIEKNNFSQYILDTQNIESKSNSSSENQVSNETNSAVDENQNNENISIDIDNNSSKMADALKYGLVKLYGEKINQKGNFSIIGHNDDKNFSILNELEVGDKFSIKTLDSCKKYIITEIYNIDPTDLKALMPKDDVIEVTLITCTYGSNQRLVVKALEENEDQLSKDITKNSNNSIQ